MLKQPVCQRENDEAKSIGPTVTASSVAVGRRPKRGWFRFGSCPPIRYDTESMVA